ncbi:DUF1684 domain-containing protein [Agromyces endophyticus]|uniref:DUF1684 domain-containing protein n=1 Tax=Agromyces sp. H17E-10 TaxID=2932244 RepID=UPI001FD230C3|nr:DUF1684 domain-containing protein [Agromyces sp. H17E-10]UOQ88474.1 DUF1684 domain-containing protein [Agromyces sp. H17E-10]
MTTDRSESDWQAWRTAREQRATAPHGLAALRYTHWLFAAEPETVEGAPGRWSADGGVVVGVGLEDAAGPVRLAPGDQLVVGATLLRAFERDGALALRVLDPEAPTRTSLAGIDAYPFAPEWVVRARFEAADGGSIDVTSVDGHASTEAAGGVARFDVDGTPVELTLTRDAGGLGAVFADATSGSESYRFRFLAVGEPDADGTLTLDFNRAYLPPCAFSDQYVCPLPSAGNRWPVAVRAGERLPVPVEASRTANRPAVA